MLKIAAGAILQTVIRGIGIEKRTLGPTEIEQPCPFCIDPIYSSILSLFNPDMLEIQ